MKKKLFLIYIILGVGQPSFAMSCHDLFLKPKPKAQPLPEALIEYEQRFGRKYGSITRPEVLHQFFDIELSKSFPMDPVSAYVFIVSSLPTNNMGIAAMLSWYYLINGSAQSLKALYTPKNMEHMYEVATVSHQNIVVLALERQIDKARAVADAGMFPAWRQEGALNRVENFYRSFQESLSPGVITKEQVRASVSAQTASGLKDLLKLIESVDPEFYAELPGDLKQKINNHSTRMPAEDMDVIRARAAGDGTKEVLDAETPVTQQAAITRIIGLAERLDAELSAWDKIQEVRERAQLGLDIIRNTDTKNLRAALEEYYFFERPMKSAKTIEANLLENQFVGITHSAFVPRTPHYLDYMLIGFFKSAGWTDLGISDFFKTMRPGRNPADSFDNYSIPSIIIHPSNM